MPSDWLNDWEKRMDDQPSLFAPLPKAAWKKPTPHPLRPYQEEAVSGAISCLKDARSTIIVLPTGMGKTRCITEVIARMSLPTLFLAHRDELIQQAVARIINDTGFPVEVDKAESYGRNAKVIVGSIQTVNRDYRLERFSRDRFGLVIVDECHHAASDSYRKVLDYFGPAKVLGVTATPDRSDEKAMGEVFETVAYDYEIVDAIREGWLCPIEAKRVVVAGLDMSKIRTIGGDFNQGDLDAVMSVEGVLHGVADAVIRETGNLKTIIYTTSIENARRIAEILNRHREGCARSVDSKDDSSRINVEHHKRGDFQYLVNVGILTEGYDDPSLECIVIARPTKSRSLYAQIMGRGLRPFPPKKTRCLVIDFTGNTGRHSLSSPADVLGGLYSEEEIEKAEELVENGQCQDVVKALDEAKLLLDLEKAKALAIASRAKIKVSAIYTKTTVDPFSVLGIGKEHERQSRIDKRFGGSIPSDAQVKCLVEKFKVPIPEGITKREASSLIDKLITRSREGLATFKQVALLKKYGVSAEDFTFEGAGKYINAIVANGWRSLPFERALAMADIARRK